jgi:hydrogenase expression/formation protein HypE
MPVRSTGARPGDHVLVTKGIALEGTAILAADFSDIAIDLGLNETDLAIACELMNQVSIIPEALALADQGATAMHDVTRGGLLETLLEIAYLSEVAIEVDYNRLLILEIVSKFAETFGFNPIQMISSGTLVVTLPPEKVANAAHALNAIACPFKDIGRVVEGEGVYLQRQDVTTHHKDILAEEDELARMWTLFRQDK